MKNLEAIKALSDIAASWGGSVHLISMDLWYEIKKECVNGNAWTAPPEDGHYLNYKTKEFRLSADLGNAGVLIHEMGHCFASFVAPDDSAEWDWFGWEICLAKQVGCYDIWSKSCREYVVGGEYRSHTWGGLSCREKDVISRDRVAYAKKRLLVTEDDKPIPIR